MQVNVPFLPLALTIRFERRPLRSFTRQLTLRRTMLLIALLSLPMWYAAMLYRAAVAQERQTAEIRRRLAARGIASNRGRSSRAPTRTWLFRHVPWIAPPPPE